MAKIYYIINRELRFLFVKRKAMAFYCFIYPLILFSILLLTFSSKVITEVPIAVVDKSGSPASKTFIRNLRASVFLNPKYGVESYDKALALLLQGDVFGIVVIDRDFQKDILKLKSGKVSAYINNQYLLIGGVTSKALVGVADASSNLYKSKTLMSFGVPPYALEVFSSPIGLSESILFNNDMNYVHFLVLALIPAILQLLIVLTIVFALLNEVKTGRAKEIRRIMSKAPMHIVGAKVLLYAAIYLLMFLIMFGILFLFFKQPVRGSFTLIFLGALAFCAYTCSTGVLICGFSNNLRFGLSSAAVYSAPAFAYFGASFPVDSMPGLARAWAEFLPGTHFNRILVNESMRGGNPYGSLMEIAIMLGLAFVFIYIGSKMYSRWTKDESKWGPEL